MEFAAFKDAYAYWLRSVFEEPEFRNAPRGFPSRERLGVSFRLLDPIQRHLPLASRRTNLVFNFAEALWYLSGTNDLEQIAYYASSIRKFSMDGRTLAGTAYGPRIFRHGEQRLDQWSQVLMTLTEDRDSKRAVMQIFQAPELAVVDNIDVACTLALQFFIREDRLHGVGFMRANDAFRGVASDVFSFTLLLELMANQLGLRVGTYTHHVGSLHVYESDRAWAQRVLDEHAAGGETSSTPFPAMPIGDNWPYVTAVLELERALRTDTLAMSADAVRRLDLPHYWRQVVAMFEVYRQIRQVGRVDPAHLDVLDPVYRRATLTRWPDMAARSAGVDATAE
jgi:thymidylate synthase